MKTRFFALILLSVFTLGCTGDSITNISFPPDNPGTGDGGTPAAVDASGLWRGFLIDLQGSIISQAVILTLQQSGVSVTGNYQTGAVTWSGSVTGTVGTANATGVSRFSGTVSFADATGTCSGLFDGTISAAQLEIFSGLMTGGCATAISSISIRASR